MIEMVGRSLNEEMFGHWAKRWRDALLNQYKSKTPICIISKCTKEADLQ